MSFFDHAAELYASAPRTRNFGSRRRLFVEAARFARARNEGSRTPVCLDLGCGPGPLSQAIAEAGFRVIGCDASEAMITRAREAVPAGEFVHAELAEFLGRFERRVDLIVCSSVLEYLEDPREVIRLTAAHLNEHGVLAVSAPNRRSLSRLLQRGLMLKTPRERRYTAQWRNTLTVDDVVEEAKKQGLQLLYRRYFGSFESGGVRLPGERRPSIATMILCLFCVAEAEATARVAA